MVETSKPLSEQYIDNIPTLNVDGAKLVASESLSAARELNVGGFLIFLSRAGMQVYSEASGASARPAHVEIAHAKASTVLNMRKSTRRLAEWLVKERAGARPEDFGEQIQSLLAGGVAIFADETRSRFVGAVAFSGGSPEQDEYICLKGVYESGLYSDIPLQESEIRLHPRES